MAETCPILIASDLSDASEVAMTRATQLAARRSCPLTALHVIQEEPWWWVIKSRDLDPDDLRAELLREALAGLKSQLQESAGRLAIEPPESDVQARLGKPAMVVSEMAAAIGARLVVVGAHGSHA